MCGIAGVVGHRPADPKRVEATLALMHNRGPDAGGVYQGRLGGHRVTLLHTRLSIIDLDPRADQPFVRDGLALVHNGEIYNYLEVRAELRAKGRRFKTESDTEVILEAYRAWGDDCVGRFNGMWAFALLDERSGRLLLSRDRFGEKPLFWMRREGALYFGSEVKYLAELSGVRPAVNEEQIARYLVNGYKCLYKQPDTYFREVQELPAASVAVLTGPEEPAPRRFWRLGYTPRPMTAEEAAEGTRERLTRAVELRLRADVPLAFCLSGGVDSCGLAGIAAKEFGQHVHTFSVIDRDERYDESANIQATVEYLGCDQHLVHTSTQGFFERMADLVDYHDAPVATISYYVHSFLSEAIHDHGYKVAVSGTAADELFAGYYDHYAFWLAERHGRQDFPALLEDWRQGYGAHVRNPLLQDPLRFVSEPCARNHILLNRDVFMALLRVPFDEPFSEHIYSGNLLRSRMLNELQHETVPVLLREDDLNSMRVSVENRSPYLDHELAEFAFSIPNEHLIREGYAKWPLRTAVEGWAPEKVRLDKRKRGFNASIDSLVDRSGPETIERLLAPGPVFDLVDRERFAKFLNKDMTDNSFSKFLFSFISARLFLDQQAASPRSARPAVEAGAHG